MNQLVYGLLFGVVGGMMIMIVILELLPTAFKYDPIDKCVSTSLAAGMVIMASFYMILSDVIWFYVILCDFI